jgi:hypothetical protein
MREQHKPHDPPIGAAADSLAVEEPTVPIWLIGACSAGVSAVSG